MGPAGRRCGCGNARIGRQERAKVINCSSLAPFIEHPALTAAACQDRLTPAPPAVCPGRSGAALAHVALSLRSTVPGPPQPGWPVSRRCPSPRRAKVAGAAGRPGAGRRRLDRAGAPGSDRESSKAPFARRKSPGNPCSFRGDLQEVPEPPDRAAPRSNPVASRPGSRTQADTVLRDASFPIQAYCASLTRRLSYARKSRDLTADSEQPSTFAI